jgi:predicted CXXCH cytochrome family protein
MSAIAVVVLSLTAHSEASAQTIVGTKHDLSANATTLGITNYNQVCVYCHAPHNASTTLPLWNHTPTATVTFQMYNSSNSSTMNMTVGTAPGTVSLACLSCHDGTIGLDVVQNIPAGKTTTPAVKVTGSHLLGSDLRNDHPIAVTYSTAADPAFVAATLGKVGGTLPLYGTGKDQVECASCHNVHNNANGMFLRLSNTASALCLTCHIK